MPSTITLDFSTPRKLNRLPFLYLGDLIIFQQTLSIYNLLGIVIHLQHEMVTCWWLKLNTESICVHRLPTWHITRDKKPMSSSPYTVGYCGKCAMVDLGTGVTGFSSGALSRDQLSTHRDNWNAKYYKDCWADKHKTTVVLLICKDWNMHLPNLISLQACKVSSDKFKTTHPCVRVHL